MKSSIIILIFITLSSCNQTHYNLYDSDGNKKGKWIIMNSADSVQVSILNYKKGTIEGKAIEFRENEVKAIGNFKENVKIGPWEYFKSDTLIKKIYYVDGFVSRIEFIQQGKVINQIITDPPF